MQRSLMLSIAVGALTLGLSFSVAKAMMPIPNVAPGVHAGAAVTLVEHNTQLCRDRLRRCEAACGALHGPDPRHRACLRRCREAYVHCLRLGR